LYKQSEAQQYKARTNKMPITIVQPGDTVYVDIRYFGFIWYDKLLLPDSVHSRYMVEMMYIDISKSLRKITAKCELFDEELVFDHYTVIRFGTNKVIKENMQLIDTNFCIKYPQILPDNTRKQLIQRYKKM
jgi:hypothetical protein